MMDKKQARSLDKDKDTALRMSLIERLERVEFIIIVIAYITVVRTCI